MQNAIQNDLKARRRNKIVAALATTAVILSLGTATFFYMRPRPITVVVSLFSDPGIDACEVEKDIANRISSLLDENGYRAEKPFMLHDENAAELAEEKRPGTYLFVSVFALRNGEDGELVLADFELAEKEFHAPRKNWPGSGRFKTTWSKKDSGICLAAALPESLGNKIEVAMDDYLNRNDEEQ